MATGSLTDSRKAQLNEAQNRAADSVAQGWDGDDGSFQLPIVEGPPGTGKTTVGVVGVASFIQEHPDQKIAYLAYTNFAAEKAREEFFKLGLGPNDVVRLAADSRERDPASGILGCNSELSDLTPDTKRRLKGARVLVSTLQSSGRIFKVPFSNPLIVIDEFSQVSPALFFSTVSKVSATTKFKPAGFVLLGDPNQLPVITLQTLLRQNIGTYMMSRKRTYEPHKLEIQYRMNERICRVVNALRDALNAYPLTTHSSARDRILTDFGFAYKPSGPTGALREMLDPSNPLVVINTDAIPGLEAVGFGKSTLYKEEAKLAAAVAFALRRSYKRASGERLLPRVLAPYNAQIGAIQESLKEPELQQACLSVYKAQGREYEAVVVSFTRKNPERNIGFLGDPQLRAQTYVACSRAMAKLILLLSFKTFEGYRDFGLLLKACDGNALVQDGKDLWRAIQ